jgi:hypothetical protein
MSIKKTMEITPKRKVKPKKQIVMTPEGYGYGYAYVDKKDKKSKK